MVNAGFRKPTYKINGFSFQDTNNDNIRNNDDPFLAGSVITLKTKAGANVGTQTSTANNPGYTFNNLAAGDYCMSASVPTGYNRLTVTNNDNSFDNTNNFCFILNADRTVNAGFKKQSVEMVLL
ncbi:hypothetical protein SAMD00019534_041280 [Acytostelium subglobosum LB1]|uniref:hypothetical protein n=1 Tax=Acytostelium subglobosum LB1 TaxID=1410327 RepID=UPI0006448336|nr:hypothetical protein SAMD00019534_041280 [Acytostelium subglobosum LB1]GAM20953.1 hypothetical protein SAMD00019534_041280 [Acytostelium subglobosum LB1]|eukprot:XP_012756087.1 hypothetical protein SAMD00019534_041280 [Acytostelium subglobosum LB1]